MARDMGNGRFVAYISDETGNYEVYIQRFPGGGGKAQVSTKGGVQARWSRDGKELFYVQGDTLIAVAITTSPIFSCTCSTCSCCFRYSAA